MPKITKNISSKLFLTLGIVSISLFFLFGAKTIYAAQCGPNSSPSKPVCACGDTVMGNYTLTGNLSCTGAGLIIGANGITIDGNNKMLTGGGSGDGILNSGHDNVTIKNFNITNFSNGISFESSNSNNITNNISNSNTSNGINLGHSSSNSLANNTTNSNANNGISLSNNSNSNNLTNNTANSNSGSSFNEYVNAVHSCGIYIYYSSNNKLGLDGIPGSGNTANYNDNTGIYISNSDGIHLNYNTTNFNNIWGILNVYGDNNILTGNTANSNIKYGIQLDVSNYVTLTGNTANSNSGWDGIYLYNSSHNTVTNNTLKNNNYDGMRIRSGANSNNITNNVINSNIQGGIHIVEASLSNAITDNTFYTTTLPQFAISQTNNSTGTIFKDNIVYGGEYVSVEDDSQANSQYNYNDYYGCSSGCFSWLGNTYGTFSDWKTNSGQDANSLNSNPKFTNTATNNFTLQSTSPVIDAGIDMNISTDYIGHSRYDDLDVANMGSAGSYTKTYVDMGAYEYVKPTAKEITDFNFNTLNITGTVTESAQTISLTVPYGTNVTALVPTILITGSSVSPASGLAHDFTTPATYTVTAADSSTQDYIVTVTIAPNTAKAITAFNFNALNPAVTGTITESTHTIALTVPYGTDVTALVPTITITGSSISPASGVANSFTSPATYTVTAANSMTQDYTVTVNVAANTTPAPVPVVVGGGGGGGLLLPTNPNIQTNQANMTQQQLEAAIAQLKQKLLALIAQQQTPLSSPSTDVFTKKLYLGVRDDQVTKLQTLLSRYQDIYPEAKVTGYYWKLTYNAVGRFQIKYGIITDSTSSGYGMVGPKTRQILNQMYTK